MSAVIYLKKKKISNFINYLIQNLLIKKALTNYFLLKKFPNPKKYALEKQ